VAVFCLIHGNWHDGSCWGAVVDELEDRGHSAVAPDLPLEPGIGWEERVEPALASLDGVEGPVIVVGHSNSSGYAAIVASRVPGALLVYLCPRMGEFDHPPGEPQVFRETMKFPERRPDGAIAWDPEVAIDAMYGRLPFETARALAARLRPAAPPAGDFPLAEPPDVPTALIYATEDEFFEPDYERFIARELLGVEPIEIPGGHFPMAEDPAGLADLLDGLASSNGDRRPPGRPRRS
jgi:pimeloyl-ACP methyl ester carboxylesterase